MILRKVKASIWNDNTYYRKSFVLLPGIREMVEGKELASQVPEEFWLLSGGYQKSSYSPG